MTNNVQTPSERSRCVFTICTKSYIGLAEALFASMENSGVKSDRYMVIVDHDIDEVTSNYAHIVSARVFCRYTEEEWTDRTFKYGLVELCTSIKARCFTVTLGLGYEKVIYFDPDILVFDDMEGIFGALDLHDAIVTPHRLDVESDAPSRGGIFNLGFLGVRYCTTTQRVMNWWDHRLTNFSVNDPIKGYFTDQKWMDHLPVVMSGGSLQISNHPGMNLGPWNLHERELLGADHGTLVRVRSGSGAWNPLIFVHYSAFNYRELAFGIVSCRTQEVCDRMPGFENLVRVLATHLQRSRFLEFSDIPYQFERYSDGTAIHPGHRRIYARLRSNGELIRDPFSSNGVFFASLRASGMMGGGGTAWDTSFDSVPTQHVGRATRVLDVLSKVTIQLAGYSRFALLSKFLIRYFHSSNHARFVKGKGAIIGVEYF